MRISDLFQSKNKIEKGSEAVPSEPEEAPSNIHRSPVLRLLSKRLSEDRKFNILDLGPPLKENVNYFSQFRCKITIDDFYASFRDFDFFEPADECSPENLFSYLLPFPEESRFDIIFLWDILNYMKLEETEHLLKYLGRFAKPGTSLFAMIFTKREIPEVPISFRIVDHEKLHYDSNSNITKTSPRHEGSAFEQRLGEFMITNSFLLRNGFKEYLLTYQ